jgi:hydrogenase nickel incorporation protein HypA/HybF
MHELSLARSIAAIVADNAGGRRVGCVRVALGPLACVERSSLEFCWGVVTEGSPLDGAALAFVEAEGDTFVVREIEVSEDA